MTLSDMVSAGWTWCVAAGVSFLILRYLCTWIFDNIRKDAEEANAEALEKAKVEVQKALAEADSAKRIADEAVASTDRKIAETVAKQTAYIAVEKDRAEAEARTNLVDRLALHRCLDAEGFSARQNENGEWKLEATPGCRWIPRP